MNKKQRQYLIDLIKHDLTMYKDLDLEISVEEINDILQRLELNIFNYSSLKIAVEFGFKEKEKGNNLQKTLEDFDKLMR